MDEGYHLPVFYSQMDGQWSRVESSKEENRKGMCVFALGLGVVAYGSG